MATDTRERMEEMSRTILLLEEELERMQSPPYMAGTVLDMAEETVRISIDGQGIYEIINVPEEGPGAKIREELKRGARVIVNPKTMAIAGYSEFEQGLGDTVFVDEVVDDNRLRVKIKGEPRIVLNSIEGAKPGDEVLLDGHSMLAVEAFSRKKTQYNLEKIPEAPWSNIGGLEATIAQIKAEVEEPFLHKETFKRYGRTPIKGILLYGPPGCGKTMIAKSIAYNLTQLVSNGNSSSDGHFINVKGPEILDKWVGNSEANIRNIYMAARECAQENGLPTVVFIDEAESVLKRRGSGVSTDVYDSIVPQFLAEMQGLDESENVITVLATNRADIIDPAILREGRVDRKIRVPRPNEEGAKEIFEIYLSGKPFDRGLTRSGRRDRVVDEIVEGIYDGENLVYRVISPQDGEIGSFSRRHLISGAMIKGVVDRATGYAIRREIDSGKKSGLTKEDLYMATEDAFRDNSGFVQTLTDGDWKDVFGARGSQYQQLCQKGYFVMQGVNGFSGDSEESSRVQRQAMKGGMER